VKYMKYMKYTKYMKYMDIYMHTYTETLPHTRGHVYKCSQALPEAHADTSGGMMDVTRKYTWNKQEIHMEYT
jgi:hypothetical protein